MNTQGYVIKISELLELSLLISRLLAQQIANALAGRQEREIDSWDIRGIKQNLERIQQDLEEVQEPEDSTESPAEQEVPDEQEGPAEQEIPDEQEAPNEPPPSYRSSVLNTCFACTRYTNHSCPQTQWPRAIKPHCQFHKPYRCDHDFGSQQTSSASLSGS